MKKLLNAINMAVSMFTVIPLPKQIWDEEAGKYIMRVYPLVGFIVGLIWYCVYKIFYFIGAAPMITAAILVAVPFLLTGFIHLDGYMDVCDALLSRRPKEVKLRILKDSTVGAFSVIALALLFLLEFAAMSTFISEGLNPIVLIFIPIISRCISAYSLLTKESIGESYYGKLFKEGTSKVDKNIIIFIYLIACILLYLVGNKFLIMALVMGITGYILVENCNKEFDGINGDVAGYTLVLSELLGIITITLF